MDPVEILALIIGGVYASGNIGLLVRIASRLGSIETSMRVSAKRLDKHDERLRDIERSQGRLLREVQ